jgi:ketosteroid isomerase-like protein
MADVDRLEHRLQRLEDLVEIQQLFIDYGHHLDRGDFSAYAGLFTEDAELLLGPVARARGRAEIEAVMREALVGQVGSSIHIISSPIIELEGDNATAEVMWTALHRDGEGRPVVSMVGRHLDDLVREGARWRIRRRRGLIDMPSTYAPRAGEN